MASLTDRQAEVLEYIRTFIESNNYAPTIREIAAEFSCTVNGAMCHLRALRHKGAIDWTERTSRSIVVLEDQRKCPHCGGQL